MTLILARASSEFVLQVTDRLVTKNSQPFDKVANKNILYIASNAVVAIAYTGLAYIDGKPTDYWIAENLSGLEIDPYNPPMIESGQFIPPLDIGLALLCLRNELNIREQQEHLFLLISFQGWQWNSKGRLRPLVGNIEIPNHANLFEIYYEPRDWYIDGSAMTISTPRSNFSKDDLDQLSNNLRNKLATEAEIILVNAIREVSKLNSLVGPHCISILIPSPSSPNISVRYFLDDSFAISETQKLPDDQYVWGYSPWIIGQKLCLPPSQITGGFTLKVGLFTIHFSSNLSNHPDWLLYHSGQKRRKLS